MVRPFYVAQVLDRIVNGKLVSTVAGAWLLFVILAVFNGIFRETILERVMDSLLVVGLG